MPDRDVYVRITLAHSVGQLGVSVLCVGPHRAEYLEDSERALGVPDLAVLDQGGEHRFHGGLADLPQFARRLGPFLLVIQRDDELIRAAQLGSGSLGLDLASRRAARREQQRDRGGRERNPW